MALANAMYLFHPCSKRLKTKNQFLLSQRCHINDGIRRRTIFGIAIPAQKKKEGETRKKKKRRISRTVSQCALQAECPLPLMADPTPNRSNQNETTKWAEAENMSKTIQRRNTQPPPECSPQRSISHCIDFPQDLQTPK